ncbi:amidohydrolase family protein [Campylobacter upsaliensis]|uniref:amidohydrolase family protein n=1 Tax=Campylobacter upsaliensis TaxID=28080 RepID=UPI0013FC92F0|nr:amidohydrolase family protein [Campylobacter upsaliensis]ECP5135922.1 amidohydrolase family protein [Campylobacter upsaliensis]EDP6903805.1 amidohydrolase family protein [Campylobacter upsaliensis]EFO9376321.1 amidohydrolase family protein [Campylobacter upsaliensis]EKY8778516.1 amidohydrolase family protein [Campylobacter upsaliensis]ELM9574689.1 amidohydrolase family protein [Campylobacter upsaliensis]
MIIKNAKIYGKELKDLEISQGLIQKIGENLQGEEIFDAKGLTLLPSFIDLCVYLKNDKFSLNHLDLLEKECLKGGVSTILLRDVMDFDEETFILFLQNLSHRTLQIFSSVKVKEPLKNIASMINQGAVALELESKLNANILKIAMQYALMKKVPIFAKCLNEDFDDNGVMNDCLLSSKLGLIGMSEIAESSEVAKLKEIAAFYQSEVIYDCLSLARSLKIATDETILVSIHHLIKNENACENFNTAAKIKPPLRSEEDRAFLQNALKKGKIRFLSAMHCPKSSNLKDLAFDEAAFGIHSICEYVSLCYNFLVQNDFISWEKLCEATSLNPAKFLKLNSGEIKEGKEANLILFDENVSTKAPLNSLYSKDTLKGEVKHHLLKGEFVF